MRHCAKRASLTLRSSFSDSHASEKDRGLVGEHEHFRTNRFTPWSGVTLATPWTLLSKVPAIWRHRMMHGSDYSCDYSSDLSMYCSFGQGSLSLYDMADSQSESPLTDYNGRQHRWVARRLQTPSALDVVGQRALVGHLSGLV